MNNDGKNIIFSVKSLKDIIIPYEKFDRMISNMDGSITYDKQKVRLKKNSVRDSDIQLFLQDRDGNNHTEPIKSIHYNSDEHVKLIAYIRCTVTNKKSIMSIGINDTNTDCIVTGKQIGRAHV